MTFLRAALAAGLVWGGLAPAHAALTAANTTVTNTATLDYKIGTVSQTAVTSNPADFVVDRLIDVTVTANNAGLPVVPDVGGNVLSFTVTNQSNAALDFGVAVLQTASTTTVAASKVDNLDMSNFTFVVDNGDGVYNVTDDTATSISNLGAGLSIKVFAIAKTPIAAVNGDIAGVSILVSAKEVGGAALVETTGANTAGMDTVYGDGDGPLSETNYDAKISAYSYYLVRTASLSLVKAATVVWDPINTTTNPKAIPGAKVEYCLIVLNNGDTAADSIVLSDTLPAEVTYEPGSLYVGASGDETSCTSQTGSNVTPDDGSDPAGGVVGGVVTVRTSSVAAKAAGVAGVYRATFRVIVK